MWQKLVIRFFSFRAQNPGLLLHLLVVAGIVLVASETWNHYQERRTEKIRWAEARTILVDSMRRESETQLRQLRSSRDSALTHSYNRQAASAAQLRQRDEKLEARYHATRVTLPWY